MYHPCRPAAGVVSVVSVVVPVPVTASERQCAASLRVSGCGRQMPHLPAAACTSSPNQRQREPSPSAPAHPYLQRLRACLACLACAVFSSWPSRASNIPRPSSCSLLHSGAAPPAPPPPPPYDDTATLRHTRSTTPFNVQPNPVRLNHQQRPSSTHTVTPPVLRNTSPALEAPRRRPKCLGSHVNRSCGPGAAHTGRRTGA